MPPKKGGKKTAGKKPYKKRGYKKHVSEWSNKYMAFPKRRVCVLPMMEKIRLGNSPNADISTGTPTLSVFGYEAVYQLNSIAVPRLSPTTGTNATRYAVLGYTDIAGHWNSYKVTGVDVKVKCQNNYGFLGMCLGICFQTPGTSQQITGTTFTSTDARQLSYSYQLPNTGTQSVTFKKYIPIYKLVGLRKSQFDADIANYSGAIGSSPIEIPYMRIAVCSTGETGVVSCDVEVELNYHVELWDQIPEVQPTI